MANTKKSDNRMLWIRGLIEEDESFPDNIEIEFVSEKDITGTLKYKNITCYQTSTSSAYSDKLYTYNLRIGYKRGSVESDGGKRAMDIAGKNGYFSLAPWDELVNIFSLFFQGRFWVVNAGRRVNGTVFKQHLHFKYQPVQLYLFKGMLGNIYEQTWQDIIPFLQKLENINPKWHYPIYRACAHYNSALKQIGDETDLSYIYLVSCIEALSKDSDLDPAEKDNISKIHNSIKELKLSKAIEGELLEYVENRKTGLKFRGFIKEYAPNFRPVKKDIPNDKISTMISQEEIDIYVKKVYDSRSKFLHEGEPIGNLLLIGEEPSNEDVDISSCMGVQIDGRKWKRNDIIPRPSFYATLFRQAIITHIEKLPEETSKTTP